MKVSELFPSKYMKAEADFADGETKILTIRNYEVEEIGQEKEKKAVLYFREPGSKPLVLNKTNAAMIAKHYTDDMDTWIGKRIALHVMEVQSFGDIVQAIRVKTKAPAAVASKPAPVVEDDEVGLFEGAELPEMAIGGGVPPMKK